MSLSASKRGRARAAGDHLHFSPLALFDARQPRALWGSVGVGQISCVTPSAVSVIGGDELTTLALMARVSCSASSLTGMFEWNPGLSFDDRVSIALMWQSTTP